ncbi:diguanylate cyclase [Bacillus sp. FJAT-27264]|uniref:sensor domain-containing diguanylate cyclase n=1 Tax=Paenibacillus sp. (strain DSM 101736 / FJAT-27264) TaxID=1850362 RepID=UPI000807DC74|nr:sensor domain-containing diguanylate cyclase [Bacillus sp. FJAT-27264]OBZ14667.1 diguanylate cyclase [Bacillus sp. FJAT-27264]
MPLHQEAHLGRRQKIGLTALLIGLVTMVFVLTSAILLVASYQSEKESLTETTLNLNHANASRMSQTAESLFQSMLSTLDFSAHNLMSADGPTEDIFNRYLELMRQSSSYFNSIALVNENGMIRNVSPESLGTAGLLFTSKPVLEALAAKKTYISQPYITKNTAKMTMFISQPVFDSKGRYQGMLGGTVYLEEKNIFSMIFDNNERDETGSYYYIVDSKGQVLYHPDKTRIGEDISANKVVQELIKGHSGEQEVINTGGVKMLAGYANVPASGWGIVVVSPAEVIHKQIIGHMEKIFWYTLLPFILLLAVVIVVARRLASPFVYLANLISKVGKGKIEIPAARSHWNREADLLTKTLFTALKVMQKQTDQLTRHAMTDALTGLANRRALELVMEEWIAARTPFSLIVMDVDKFKFVNDTYGHLTGDEVLKRVSGILAASVRPGDICSRYGGEEFIILLADTRAEDAYIVAERFRQTLATSEAPTVLPITVSQGIAHYPTHAQSSDMLLRNADQALYYAKNTGRNKTIISGSESEQA